MNLIQYKDLHVINLDHVRLIDIEVSNHTNRAVGIRFEFANGDENGWFFEDPAETQEVYEKLIATFVQHV